MININKRRKCFFRLFALCLILLLSNLFNIMPVYAQEQASPIKVEHIGEGRFKVVADKENFFSDEKVIETVKELNNYLYNSNTMDNIQCLDFFYRLCESDYVVITPTFFQDVNLPNGDIRTVSMNRAEYQNILNARWVSDNGFIAMATIEWVSDSDQPGYKEIGLHTALLWKKHPYYWNRHDYMVIHWDNNASYVPGSAKGMVETSLVVGDYDTTVTRECDFNVNISKYITFKGLMYRNDYQTSGWINTVWVTEFTLLANANFSYKVHFYHDQGLLSYSDILDQISVSVGIVSIPGGFLTEMKEYTPNEPTLVRI